MGQTQVWRRLTRRAASGSCIESGRQERMADCWGRSSDWQSRTSYTPAMTTCCNGKMHCSRRHGSLGRPFRKEAHDCQPWIPFQAVNSPPRFAGAAFLKARTLPAKRLPATRGSTTLRMPARTSEADGALGEDAAPPKRCWRTCAPATAGQTGNAKGRTRRETAAGRAAAAARAPASAGREANLSEPRERARSKERRAQAAAKWLRKRRESGRDGSRARRARSGSGKGRAPPQALANEMDRKAQHYAQASAADGNAKDANCAQQPAENDRAGGRAAQPARNRRKEQKGEANGRPQEARRPKPTKRLALKQTRAAPKHAGAGRLPKCSREVRSCSDDRRSLRSSDGRELLLIVTLKEKELRLMIEKLKLI